jgi:hypothetical protein
MLVRSGPLSADDDVGASSSRAAQGRTTGHVRDCLSVQGDRELERVPTRVCRPACEQGARPRPGRSSWRSAPRPSHQGPLPRTRSTRSPARRRLDDDWTTTVDPLRLGTGLQVRLYTCVQTPTRGPRSVSQLTRLTPPSLCTPPARPPRCLVDFEPSGDVRSGRSWCDRAPLCVKTKNDHRGRFSGWAAYFPVLW